MMTEKTFVTDTADQAVVLFGAYDSNALLIERHFGVKIYQKEGVIAISGEESAVDGAYRTLVCLKQRAALGQDINEQCTETVIDMVENGEEEEFQTLEQGCICLTAKGRPIKAKTIGQSKYVEKIAHNTVVFGVGPAGTGKTFLAVAMAVAALRRREVSRIVLTRPAVEAGERLGYLPGDLQSKIDPYLRPLYDALYEMMGAEGYARNAEKNVIEIAPLAYMRGRTLDDSFIILDEAQNTTPEQMKMFLTRLGSNAKAVVTGDITQTDLPYGRVSGLKEALKILEGIEDIGIHYFTEKDVVRHRLVQKIITAYEKHDREMAEQKTRRQDPAYRFGAVKDKGK